MFLIFYGLLRIISEFFREPDAQIGYLFNLASTGTILSVVMFLVGITLYLIRKNEI
jgi:phosphatidylglycerol:prolipoprotein diacylglycerol transferase